MLRLRLLTACLLLSAVPAFAAGRVQCGQSRSELLGRPVSFCALLPPSYDSDPKKQFPVLYFLHGIGEDQTFMFTTGAWTLIEEAQEQKRLGEFVIITPAAGRSFYINSKDGSVRYEDFFIREFVSAMERSFRISHVRSARAIGGVSMGGYGALRFALKYPQMFSSVAALMPALMPALPRGVSNMNLAAFIGPAFGTPVDEEFWRANTPFVYARTAKLSGLKIYFATGDQDEYGFDTGTRQLDQLLTSRHVPHTAHIYPGGHGGAFVAAHVAEALQFVWSAFREQRTTTKLTKDTK